MSYKVVWSPSALDQLTNCWFAAHNKEAVSLASLKLDQILEENPAIAGESRELTNRILLETPLGIFFEVDETLNTVFISHVWLSRRNV